MLGELFAALFQVIAEIVVGLTGYGLLRLVYRTEEINPDGFGAFSVGCLFWLLLLALVVLLGCWVYK